MPVLAVPLLVLGGATGPADAQRSPAVDQALTGNDMSFITRPLAPDYRIRKDGGVTLRVCYNWSCAAQKKITFSPEDMATVTSYMAECPGDSLHDRVQRMRIGIWQMQLLATKYVPVLANDRAINDTDGELEGRADCVDHSSNTDTYLHVLKDLGQLAGWSLAGPTVRNVLNPHAVHWTPVVTDDRTRREWSVDSWFHPNGQLPLVMPLRDWAADRKAWEPPFNRLNPYPRFLSDLCPPATAQAPP
ncbi:MAG: hypothetical protein MUE39_00475 [Gammaproteobacteria bacterium]|nr:hypothetical protein [Gammaproteobacteria bacterium]